jgi:hypothetical protein
MLLHDAHKQLGWPRPDDVTNPQGAGAQAYADFLRRKVGAALQRRFDNVLVKTGVLANDPSSSSTETPIAVVCEFPTGADDRILAEAHRLAWNFSRAAMLITLEPSRVIAWSCCENPKQPIERRKVVEFVDDSTQGHRQASSALRRMLHWLSLISGSLTREFPTQFKSEGRADELLLKNLRYVRRRLLDGGLSQRHAHDLLARVIFTQFLFHRQGADGRPFFDDVLLKSRCGGALNEVHSELSTILADKSEAYSLFRWLDDKFNGDLFPGEPGHSAEERENAWNQEKMSVNDSHMRLLSGLVSGTVDTKDQQHLLWPQYSFDTIPLEFISSVYEEFLTAEEQGDDKAYYTPSHLVDFVLDAVLPWDGEGYELQILDPCCGSGIFLVKAFQRLIYRWRRAHPDREPLVADLKPLLAKNLLGIDRNPEAVRVACFSLYLAMADAIEPKHYLKRDKVFPHLRGVRLLPADFFDEGMPGFRTEADAGGYDLVIGNAPWGDNSIHSTSDSYPVEPVPPAAIGPRRPRPFRTKAAIWAKNFNWEIVNNDIGPFFLAKGSKLVKSNGQIAMIQPASLLLYNRSSKNCKLRNQIFTRMTVEEVTNLSAIRRELFNEAIGPACIVVARGAPAAPEETLWYYSPKAQRASQTKGLFLIDPQDSNRISHSEAATDPHVWTVLALGGRRDLALIQRFSNYPTIEKLEAQSVVITRLGVIPGNKEKRLPELKGLPYFEETRFPSDVFLELDACRISPWNDPRVDRDGSIDFEAFKAPQLLIKQSFSVKDGRFRAVLVSKGPHPWGVICKKTYTTVREVTGGTESISSACLLYNSLFAAYFLIMTSSRAGHYITEATSRDLLRLPLVDIADRLEEVDSFHKLDDVVFASLQLTDAERILIDDFFKYSWEDARRTGETAGYEPTTRANGGNQDELTMFCRSFAAVLEANFGSGIPIATTVFQEDFGCPSLPVRMVAIHLNAGSRSPETVEAMQAETLLCDLSEFHKRCLDQKPRAEGGFGIGFQRTATLIDGFDLNGVRSQTVYIIKPDQRRYWTRSIGMRDADELSVAILDAAEAGSR